MNDGNETRQWLRKTTRLRTTTMPDNLPPDVRRACHGVLRGTSLPHRLSGTGDAMSAEALHTLTARQVCIPRELRLRAFVDGPADSDYAQIDEHGRYHVKLHFDIDDSEQWDGEASTWLRMLQPHGGTVEGFHFPLRKNTEVMVRV